MGREQTEIETRENFKDRAHAPVTLRKYWAIATLLNFHEVFTLRKVERGRKKTEMEKERDNRKTWIYDL